MFARRHRIFVTVGFSLGLCLLLLPVAVVFIIQASAVAVCQHCCIRRLF